MIFVAETEELSLYVFEDETSAIEYCEALDVEAAIWLFWNDKGEALEPEFMTPNKRGFFSVTNGTYRLIPASNNHHAPLLEALDHIVHVESKNQLNSIASIKRHLQDALI